MFNFAFYLQIIAHYSLLKYFKMLRIFINIMQFLTILFAYACIFSTFFMVLKFNYLMKTLFILLLRHFSLIDVKYVWNLYIKIQIKYMICRYSIIWYNKHYIYLRLNNKKLNNCSFPEKADVSIFNTYRFRRQKLITL